MATPATYCHCPIELISSILLYVQQLLQRQEVVYATGETEEKGRKVWVTNDLKLAR